MDEKQARRNALARMPPSIVAMIERWNAELGEVVGRDPLRSPPYKKYQLPSKGTR